MLEKYDKVDKDNFCEIYEKNNSTGSDGKTAIGTFEGGAIKIFGSVNNFLEYFNNPFREASEQNPIQTTINWEQDEDSQLVKIAIEKDPKKMRGKDKRTKLKSALGALAKEKYDFKKTGYDYKYSNNLNTNQMWNLYVMARKDILENN